MNTRSRSHAQLSTVRSVLSELARCGIFISNQAVPALLIVRDTGLSVGPTGVPAAAQHARYMSCFRVMGLDSNAAELNLPPKETWADTRSIETVESRSSEANNVRLPGPEKITWLKTFAPTAFKIFESTSFARISAKNANVSGIFTSTHVGSHSLSP